MVLDVAVVDKRGRTLVGLVCARERRGADSHRRPTPSACDQMIIDERHDRGCLARSWRPASTLRDVSEKPRLRGSFRRCPLPVTGRPTSLAPQRRHFEKDRVLSLRPTLKRSRKALRAYGGLLF